MRGFIALTALLALAACEPSPTRPDVVVDGARPFLADEGGRSLCALDLDDNVVCNVDFGEVERGTAVVRRFVVENHGDRDLALPFWAFSGGGDAGFALVSELPRTIKPAGRGVVDVEFAAGDADDAGLRDSALFIDDDDDDDSADLVVSLRADVIACGEASAAVSVVSVNGIDVDDDAALFVGDSAVLEAAWEECDGPAAGGVRWRLLNGPGGFLQVTGERAVLRLDQPGDFLVQATVVADDGSALAVLQRTFTARLPSSIGFQAFGTRLHVARDGLAWCSDSDCYAGHCDVVWGLRGEQPNVGDAFSLANPADGTYTAAAVVDDDSDVVVKAFVDGQLDLEVARSLAPGEPRLLARIVVENGVASSIAIDDTSPQPGDCF